MEVAGEHMHTCTSTCASSRQAWAHTRSICKWSCTCIHLPTARVEPSPLHLPSPFPAGQRSRKGCRSLFYGARAAIEKGPFWSLTDVQIPGRQPGERLPYAVWWDGQTASGTLALSHISRTSNASGAAFGVQEEWAEDLALSGVELQPALIGFQVFVPFMFLSLLPLFQGSLDTCTKLTVHITPKHGFSVIDVRALQRSWKDSFKIIDHWSGRLGLWAGMSKTWRSSY